VTTPPDASRRNADALSPERWAQVRALVDEAIALPAEARAVFLNSSCGDDVETRRRVERLVAACDRDTGSWEFLAHSAGELAAPLIAEESMMTNSLARTDGPPAAFCVALADRYRVGAELGRGGMATVFAAEDLRHHRRVAIKVLDPDLGAMLGADRFLAEIRVTANLQHPNLLPLFDSGEAGGLLYYVMPLIEGSTLRARLQRERQLPVDETVRIVCAVAGALDYAHRQGVVHRDLKPENILLHDGQPLVADFGIALAVSNAGGARVTQTGLSLGTPQYMSPEQAMGDRVIDGRSDVYSLAAVAYETLTGEPPHVGATAQAVIGRMLAERAPSARITRRAVPEHVDLALQRALEKLPADRWPTASAFATALSTATVTSPTRKWPSVRQSLPWVAIPLALAAGFWLAPRATTSVLHPVASFTITLPPDLRLTRGTAGQSGSAIRVAIAPNGTLLVLTGTRVGDTGSQLYARPLDGSTGLTPIQGTEGAEQPFFSPDGKWIGFMQGGRLRKVPTGGGVPVTIAELMPYRVNGLSWGEDVIVFGRGFGPLMQLNATGGAPQVVAIPDTIAAEAFVSPQILPDGRTVLATRGIPQGAPSVVAVTLATGDTATVVKNATSGRYVHAASGDVLVYTRGDGAVMAAPFDLRRRQVSDPAVAVASTAGVGASTIAVALDGTFAFQRGVPRHRQLVIRERDGSFTTLIEAGIREYRTARFSPDGKHIVAGVHVGNVDAASDIWTYDLERRTPSQFTFDGASNIPEYTQDGRWISYNSLVRPNDRELRRMRVGGGTPETVLAAPGQQHEGIVTRDGATLVYREINAQTLTDIWAVDLTRPATERLASRRPLAVTAADENGIALSPDDQWLAFTSNASGPRQIFVRSLADSPEGPRQVSPSGGGEPRWDPSGRALYYRNGDTLFSVAIERAPAFRLGRRQVVFTGVFVSDPLGAYDVSRDGRFLLLRDVEPSRAGELTVVLHALDAIGRRSALPLP